ncbi:MAG: ImmA/IrrE family metallo-endopeptidase [Clostridiales Family XIII bacterium]|nr:ImmA/IrrE family metallo-endopeptidase [Clostridia bacterium]MDY3011460.1 ImmA/IrrE family metallo-endopeptidase [Clostridiales Family XIII bacterium]
MSSYIDKNSLYKKVQYIRNHLKITYLDYPLDSLKLCSEVLGKKMGYAPFKAPALRGIAAIDKNDYQNDVILLNSARTKIEQNFDCAHEIIHTIAHRNLPGITSFSCFETVGKKQDPFIEWQANEGAAELLVPYRIFIPLYLEMSRKYARDFSNTPPEKPLARRFRVTEGVIHNRIESLNYEIYQYVQYGDINNIEILSQRKQKERGWDKRHDKLYCKNCLSPIEKASNYCPICGTKFPKDGLHRIGYIFKGAGFMKYDGIKLNEHNRPLECPCCKNEEIHENANYCMICGKWLLNQCENEDCPEFDKPLPGNARYCSTCGSTTTYSNLGYLESWDGKTIKNHDDDIPPGFRAVEDDDIPF